MAGMKVWVLTGDKQVSTQHEYNTTYKTCVFVGCLQIHLYPALMVYGMSHVFFFCMDVQCNIMAVSNHGLYLQCTCTHRVCLVQETAVNIGFSSRLLSENMDIIKISASSLVRTVHTLLVYGTCSSTNTACTCTCIYTCKFDAC